MYYIYRSRFQPDFCMPHREGIKKFYVMEKTHQILGGTNLALGIVAEALLKNKGSDLFAYGEVNNQKMKEGLSNRLDQNLKKYIGRFRDELNPSSLGMIKKSIWDAHSDMHKYTNNQHKYLPCITIPNLALTAIFYYDMKLNNSVIINWLPEGREAKNDIGWYIPIYDNDDINDIGLLGTLLNECNITNPTNKIVFARYLYDPNNYNCTFFAREYGYYLQTVVNANNSKFDINKIEPVEIEGMRIPNKNSIPFVYLSFETEAILKLFKDYLNKWLLTTANEQLTTEINNLSNRIDRISDLIPDTRTPFAEDLAMFFAFFNNDLSHLKSLCSSENTRDIMAIISLITKPYLTTAQDSRWLETSIDSALRLCEIKNLLQTQTKGTVQ
jgi:hypothetical protein